MHATERPSPRELDAICAECSGRKEADLGDLGHDADFDRCECGEAEVEVPAPPIYHYEVELGLDWRVPCESYRRALEVSDGQGWFRIRKLGGHVPVDEDDDGLDERELLALEAGPGLLRDVLVEAIDSRFERG